MAASRARRRFRELFAVGLAVVLPLLVTYLLLRFLFEGLDDLLHPIIQGILGRRIPGLGFLAAFVIIFLAGALTTNIVGRKLVAMTESLLLRIPLVKNIYAASKQLFDALTLPGKGAFRQVVMLEYPRPGLYALGFITASGAEGFQDLVGEKTVNVFIPTAPNPDVRLLSRRPRKVGHSRSHLCGGGIEIDCVRRADCPRRAATSSRDLRSGPSWTRTEGPLSPGHAPSARSPGRHVPPGDRGGAESCPPGDSSGSSVDSSRPASPCCSRRITGVTPPPSSSCSCSSRWARAASTSSSACLPPHHIDHLPEEVLDQPLLIEGIVASPSDPLAGGRERESRAKAGGFDCSRPADSVAGRPGDRRHGTGASDPAPPRPPSCLRGSHSRAVQASAAARLPQPRRVRLPAVPENHGGERSRDGRATQRPSSGAERAREACSLPGPIAPGADDSRREPTASAGSGLPAGRHHPRRALRHPPPHHRGVPRLRHLPYYCHLRPQREPPRRSAVLPFEGGPGPAAPERLLSMGLITFYAALAGGSPSVVQGGGHG